MDQLSAQDAQFLFMEDSDVVANITGAYICDQSKAPGGHLRFKQIRDRIEERFSASPLFRRKLLRLPMDLDYPYWVDDPYFDISYHVHHARLPKPADWRQFCIHLARYHSRPLDMGRPLWDVYILEGLDNIEGVPKGSFAILVKVHHAAVDGVAGLQMLGALMDVAPDGPPAFRYPPTDPPSPPPALSELLRRAAVNNALSPLQLAEAAGRSSPQIARMLTNIGKSRRRRIAPPGVPLTVFNEDVSPNKAFDAVEFELAAFKNIRAAYPEAKINDLVLAVCGGGIRRYLSAQKALPKESLIAMAPINARPNDEKSKTRQGAGNNISAMNVPLYTNIAHPIERLKAIVLATRKTKAAKDGVAARLLTDLTRHAPASMMTLTTRILTQTVASGQLMNNLIVSNVPGPQTPLYFCGAKMVSMYGLAPLGSGMGLFIATPSYNGKIAFCVTSTLDIIPDTPFFIECLKESFEELTHYAERRVQANVQAQRKSKKKKAAAKKKTKKKTTPSAKPKKRASKANGASPVS